jgi:hypothetical protein
VSSPEVKITFPLDVDEDGYPPVASETLNARLVEDGFILENTPFFATGVALGDCVEAQPIHGAEPRYLFSGIVRSSTSKSLSIIFLDPAVRDSVYQHLKQLGCYCEYGEFGPSKDLKMLAVSVPDSCDYDALASYLYEHENKHSLSFAELAV